MKKSIFFPCPHITCMSSNEPDLVVYNQENIDKITKFIGYVRLWTVYKCVFRKFIDVEYVD